MEVTFQNRRSDLEALHEHILKQTQEGKQLGKQVFIQRQIRALLLLALISALAWGILSNLGARNALLTSVLLFLYLLMLAEGLFLLIVGFKPYYYFGKVILARQAKLLTEEELAIFQLPKTLTADSDWLEVRSSEALHRWRWRLVEEVRLTSEFIFVHVGKCHLFPISKRDFQSEQDFAEFGNKLVELYKELRDQPALAEAKREKSAGA